MDSRRDSQSGCWWICWVRKEPTVCWLEGSSAILRSRHLFLSNKWSVTRLCFYSLSNNVSNDLRHLGFSLSLLAICTQKKKKKEKQKKLCSSHGSHKCSFSVTINRCVALVSCEVLNVHSIWFHFFSYFNRSSGILLKINLCATLQVRFTALQDHKVHHLHLLTRLISADWPLDGLDEIYCTHAAKFESGNVSWCSTGKWLTGPLNGLHFPSTLSAARSNHDGIKITWLDSEQ